MVAQKVANLITQKKLKRSKRQKKNSPPLVVGTIATSPSINFQAIVSQRVRLIIL